ncbi:MAG TPA: alkaline phosphatase family protein [Armatimonadota bacterium]|nr:alkaline phosphatase family protein [Armatimonadota bacterium]
MPRHHPRAIVIGIDSVSMKLLERFAAEGCLPHIADVMQRGAALPAMSCIPAYTPTNWATLATGAWPGTHGAGNWFDLAPTDPPGRTPMSTFDSRAITAETIWEAAERQGLTSLAIAYPGSSPSRLERGMVVAPLPAGLMSLDLVAGCEYGWGVDKPQMTPLTPEPAGGRPAPTAGSLAALLPVAEAGPRSAAAVGAVEDGADAVEGEIAPSDGLVLRLVARRGAAGYERVLIYDGDENAAPAAEMGVGEWSGWLIREFPGRSGAQPASLRFKLLELSPDGKRLRLLRSAVYPTTGFTEPAALASELVQAVGPYFEHAAMTQSADADSYRESVYEEMEYQVDWHARAAAHLLETVGWDLFYNHWHFPDTVMHKFLSRADPDSPHYAPDRASACLGVLRRAYELCDRLVGGLRALAGPDTLVAVVSDHGNASNRYVCHLERRLQEAGLLRRIGPADDAPIDWTKTLAYPHGMFQVNVNLRGRAPHGVVAPEHYERVQEQVIDALYDWRADNGRRAVALALKHRDAALVGYWSARTGDVVFIYNPGFAWGQPAERTAISAAPPGANHGPQLPTAETALSGNLATWIMTGRGIKRGYRRDPNRLGPARLIDFVPTLCHALGIAPPAHCQGAVEYDVFED